MASKKTIRMCQTCKNSVNGTYCTMQKEMSEKSRVYKKCEGYEKHVAPKKEVEIKKEDKPTNYEKLGGFGMFLKKGGGYSFRTEKFI